jgi:3-hydroxyisobutyrate dehydrogenase-like beta-hydroxyacid dehydrogenase
MSTIGIVSPGDMGCAVGRRLTASRYRVVTSALGRSSRTLQAAAAAGFVVLPRLADVAGEADLVMSLVPQDAAVAAARDFAAAAAASDARPLYLDANSLAPATMREIFAVVTEAGCECVDGAFVGSAAALGEKTVLYLSGPLAGRAAGMLAAGLRVRQLGREAGVASAFKLSVYGFNKGLVALFLEMVAAAGRIGLQHELVDCLRDFYPGSVATVDRLLPTYPRHARRREQEMAEVVEWLGEVGQSGVMAAATRAVIGEVAALGLREDADWDADALVAELMLRGLLRDRG